MSGAASFGSLTLRVPGGSPSPPPAGSAIPGSFVRINGSDQTTQHPEWMYSIDNTDPQPVSSASNAPVGFTSKKKENVK